MTRPNAWPLAATLLALLAPAQGIAGIPSWYDGEPPDDGETTALVLARLAADERMHAMDIRVHSHQGVVHLGGVVDSEASAEHAAALAHEVPGVWRVENAVAVRPTALRTGPCAAGATRTEQDHD